MTQDTKDLEQKLWQSADKLRNNMSPSEYKFIVLGLIFLKYISDSFDERYEKAVAEKYDPEDKDWYLAENVFWVPKEARWKTLQDKAKQSDIGVVVDDAMEAIERENPILKGVLPKDYAKESLDKRRLGELIDIFSTLSMHEGKQSGKDLLGQVYEYFIGMFADAEGQRGGEFYTPQSIVKLLVEMLEPYKGRIYDPCCGSGGMFVQSEKFVEAHQGKLGDVAVYGQESNQTTWKLAKMNMAIRGIDANIAFGDTLHNDKQKDLKADFVIANPPFNVSDWGGELLQDDVRWKFGVPPKGNANFAWMQHFIHHLSPKGTAGFVLANGATSSQSSGEGDIRKAIMDIFAAAGLEKPQLDLLSDEFMAEIRGMKRKNLALEALKQILNDEIKKRFSSNVVKQRAFSDMLFVALKKYKNKSIEAAQVIEELIAIAKEMKVDLAENAALDMSNDEVAFYDALVMNGSAKEVLGDEKLRDLARVLVKRVRNTITIDWAIRDSARARLRVEVKKLLREYGYPPDAEKIATELVLEQTERFVETSEK